MAKKNELRGEWVDGFLFVGNHLALDFLNTTLVDGGERVEKLPDRDAFERWCLAAGIGQLFGSRDRDESVAEVREFRERLREAVFSTEGGAVADSRFLAEVNEILSRYPARVTLAAGGGGVEKNAIFAREDDGAFWGAMAVAIAELLTEMEHHRLRKCENCVVHFYDISKKGSRRWCSMNLCGNRLKVAAYQKRQRGSEGGSHSSR